MSCSWTNLIAVTETHTLANPNYSNLPAYARFLALANQHVGEDILSQNYQRVRYVPSLSLDSIPEISDGKKEDEEENGKKTFLETNLSLEGDSGYEADHSSSDSDSGSVAITGIDSIVEDDEGEFEAESTSNIGPLLASNADESEEESIVEESTDEEPSLTEELISGPVRYDGVSLEELKRTLELNDLIIAWQNAIERGSSSEVQEQGTIQETSTQDKSCSGEERSTDYDSNPSAYGNSDREPESLPDDQPSDEEPDLTEELRSERDLSSENQYPTAVDSSSDSEPSSFDEDSSAGQQQQSGGVSLVQHRDILEANNRVITEQNLAPNPNPKIHWLPSDEESKSDADTEPALIEGNGGVLLAELRDILADILEANNRMISQEENREENPDTEEEEEEERENPPQRDGGVSLEEIDDILERNNAIIAHQENQYQNFDSEAEEEDDQQNHPQGGVSLETLQETLALNNRILAWQENFQRNSNQEATVKQAGSPLASALAEDSEDDEEGGASC